MKVKIISDTIRLRNGEIKEYSEEKAMLLIKQGVAEAYEAKEFKEVEETKEFKPKAKKTK